MIHTDRIFAAAAAVLAAVSVAVGPLRAQEQPRPAEQAGPATPAPAKKPAAAGAKLAEPAYHRPDPAVDTIVDSKPQTPRELFQAAISLQALDRADLAKQFLDQLLNAKPDAPALADLARHFGSATLMQIAGDKSLNPVGQKFAEQVFAAVAADRHDPGRLAIYLKQLADPSADKQLEALAALRDAGPPAIPFLLASITDPAQTSVRPLVRSAITGMGAAAAPPLAAALDATDQKMQIEAINLLAELGPRPFAANDLLVPFLSPRNSPEIRRTARLALERLVGAVPTKADAVALLKREARTYLERERPLRGDDSANVAVWGWDPTAKTVVMAEYPPDRASAFVAARLAADLLELSPNDVDHRRLYLISLLESAVYRAGLDNPLPTGADTEYDRAARFGVAAINDVLAEALASGHTAAAKGAAQILGNIGDAGLLTGAGPEPAPLVRALRNPDRRLRVAAAAAIMKFKPSAPFAGSSWLTDALADMAAATGRRHAAIGFPTLAPLQELAGMTNSVGFQSETGTNGRQLFAAATMSPDTELILVSARLNHSTAVEVVQQLREDPRTAQVPICVLAEVDERGFAEQMLPKLPGVFIETRPPSLEAMQRIVAHAAELAQDRFVPVKIRQQEAVAALDWLAELALLPPEIADVRRYEPTIERALYSPLTAAHAAAVLTRLATPTSQRSLVDLASAGVQPLAVRQAAAAAFGQSVRQFGVRLSPAEIARQYDRYNQSAQQDKPTQQLLGAVLDVIEKQGLGAKD